MEEIDFPVNGGELKSQNKDANLLIGAGLGLGAYVATTALTLSFVCPVCSIAAPILIGTGVYKKIKLNRNKNL